MGMITVNSHPVRGIFLNHGPHVINPRKDEFYLICVDPGRDNGIAAITVSPDRVYVRSSAVVAWEYPYVDVIGQINHMAMQLHTNATPCVLLYESFNLVSGTLVPDLAPLEVIGAMKYWHSTSDRIAEQVITRLPVTKQGNNGAASRGVTDAILKRLDMYGSGWRERHIRDAIRHGISYLAEERHPWVCANGWPQRKD